VSAFDTSAIDKLDKSAGVVSSTLRGQWKTARLKCQVHAGDCRKPFIIFIVTGGNESVHEVNEVNRCEVSFFPPFEDLFEEIHQI